MKQDKILKTFWAKIYMSGPIEEAKKAIREECLKEGLCVTIEKTDFIYVGGEESGFVVGLVNYPRFPKDEKNIYDRACCLTDTLIEKLFQHSAMIQTPNETRWISYRDH